MKIAIPNSARPKCGDGAPFAEFRLVLKRDGDRVTLECPRPHCFRQFVCFSAAEKDAYNAILSHVVETAPAALHGAARPPKA